MSTRVRALQGKVSDFLSLGETPPEDVSLKGGFSQCFFLFFFFYNNSAIKDKEYMYIAIG